MEHNVAEIYRATFYGATPSFSLKYYKKYGELQSELSVHLPGFEPDTFRTQARRVTPCGLVHVHERLVPPQHREDGASWLL